MTLGCSDGDAELDGLDVTVDGFDEKVGVMVGWSVSVGKGVDVG